MHSRRYKIQKSIWPQQQHFPCSPPFSPLYSQLCGPDLGIDNKVSDVDNMPYTTLLYANGPGYNHSFPVGRRNISGLNTEDKNYVQQSAVPMHWETHGGEDVPVYANGPMAHLFRGVVEQTYIPHAMAYAACIGPQRDDCEIRRQEHLKRQIIECPSPQVDATSASSRVLPSPVILLVLLLKEFIT